MVACPAARSRGPIFETERHALQLPVDRAPAELDVRIVVDDDADAECAQFVADPVSCRDGLVLNRHDHDLRRRERRRYPQPVIVAVHHDQTADHPGRASPGGRPRQRSADRRRPRTRC